MLPAIQKRYENLSQKRQALLKHLDSQSPEALSFKAGTDKWSVVEAIEHLVVVEGDFLEQVGANIPASTLDPGKRSPEKYQIVLKVMQRDVEVDVPHESMEPHGHFYCDDCGGVYDFVLGAGSAPADHYAAAAKALIDSGGVDALMVLHAPTADDSWADTRDGIANRAPAARQTTPRRSDDRTRRMACMSLFPQNREALGAWAGNVPPTLEGSDGKVRVPSPRFKADGRWRDVTYAHRCGDGFLQGDPFRRGGLRRRGCASETENRGDQQQRCRPSLR